MISSQRHHEVHRNNETYRTSSTPAVSGIRLGTRTLGSSTIVHPDMTGNSTSLYFEQQLKGLLPRLQKAIACKPVDEMSDDKILDLQKNQ